MLTDTELAEIDSRCKAAQRGPWMVALTEHTQVLIITHIETAVRVSESRLPEEMRQRIAEWPLQDKHGYVMPCREAEVDEETHRTLDFVAHSRTDVPKLVEEIRRLKDENARLTCGSPN